MKALITVALVASLTGCGPSAEEIAAQAKAAAEQSKAAAEQAKAAADAKQEADATKILKEAVANSLRDPASAQFRNLVYHKKGQYLCGELNAKNGYGGYTGYGGFFADVEAKKRSGFLVVLENDVGWPMFATLCK